MYDDSEYDSAHDDGTGARAKSAQGARARGAADGKGGLGTTSMKISYRSILQVRPYYYNYPYLSQPTITVVVPAHPNPILNPYSTTVKISYRYILQVCN